MRITVIAIGSQGDVLPYIALGAGLRAAGYDIRLATHSNFQQTVRDQGLEFALLEGNPKEMLETEAGKALMETGSNIVTHIRQLRSMAGETIQRILYSCWQACQGTDAIVHSAFGFGGYYVAGKLGVPSMAAYIVPVSRTWAFPSLVMPQLRLGRFYNRLSYICFEQIFWQTFKSYVNDWIRDCLGLPGRPLLGDLGAIHNRRYPIVYGYSPSVIPKPPDWGDWMHVTGYWFPERPADWQPPDELVDFLQSGPPPVYVGFGSMNNRNPEEVTGIVLKALERCKQRGILSTGWGGLSRTDLPNHVFKIDYVPFDWLFPQMAAVVHHGGAGSTAAGLRAGVPAVIIPFFADQPFWGDRVYRLGAGPKPVHRKHLSAERLSEAIGTAVSNEGFRERASMIGERIQAEDGVAGAVEIIGRYITDGRTSTV
jgi:UDP:flavonoid glycosyltransferase YjiC (YdhE family)